MEINIVEKNFGENLSLNFCIDIMWNHLDNLKVQPLDFFSLLRLSHWGERSKVQEPLQHISRMYASLESG